MKKLSIFTLSSMALAISPTANAVEWGLGASFSSDSRTTVYIPIKLSNLTLEPSFSLSKQKSTSSSLSVSSSGETSAEQVDISLGLFLNKLIKENLSFYYGGRLGYTKTEGEFAYTSGSFNLGSQQKTDGYLIKPTIGLSYNIISELSLSIETGLRHEKTSGDYNNNPGNIVSSSNPFSPNNFTEKSKNSRTTSQTDIILRYMF